MKILRIDGSTAYESQSETLLESVIEATRSGANLSGANLSRAYLSGANLSGANLDRVVVVIVASHHVITAYADRVEIGCHSHTIDNWLDNYESIGAEAHYPPEAITEYGQHLSKIKSMMDIWSEEK